MNIHPLSNLAWSCEYEFESLDITIDGIDVGDFNGTAELTEDRGYGFYVSHIVLKGTKGRGTEWRNAIVALDPSRCELSKHLLEALAEKIENSSHAEEFFYAERNEQ